MLRITMNKSASGAKKYYCEQYYKEGHGTLGYYTGDDQAIGLWGGKAAQALGLTGAINKRDFASLCDNLNPHTGKRLTGRTDIGRTVGYDFTFNASKSVSLAYALGSDSDKEAILAAFNQSVAETMRDIETGMQTRVRAKGKNENRLTGNIAYGAFTHFTTRPIDGVADPHLHSHCFVFNATYDHEGRKWKAGQFQQLKQDAPYYEAVFHSKLAHYLQMSGYRITRTKNGFELAGIEKHTIDKFSRRTQEIEAYSAEHDITDKKQKSEIGARTREAKRPLLSNEMQEKAWHDRLTPDELAIIRQLKQQRSITPLNNQSARNALQFSLNHHLERKSVASDKEILATAIKSSIGEATPQQVKQAYDADTNILSATEDLRTFITTKEALAEEKRLIRYCTEVRNRYRPIHAQYEPQNPILNNQQLRAVKHALSSTDGITIITGKAGTGKTTLMKEVQQGIKASGKEIFSFAPSSEASRGVQRSEGFENADTVAQLIQNKELHPKLKHQIIWVDEAGMLSNKDMNRILAIAEAQSARVILSGDTKQHTSVERGDALRIIQEEGGIAPVTVSKIQRQKHSKYKEVVQHLSNGNVEKGFKVLDRIGAIHEHTDSAERITAITDDYYHAAHGGKSHAAKNVLVIAPTHAEGEIVTQSIREKLKQHAIISTHERPFNVLKNRQLTEAQKQQPEHYHIGDVLGFNRHHTDIRAGSKLEVVDVDDTHIHAKDTRDNEHRIALTEARKYTVYAPQALSVSEGDTVRITKNSKAIEGKHLFNGSRHSITGFDAQGNIQLSNGSFLAQDHGHFTLGYVTTSHAAQGKTADKVILSQSSATFRASSMEQFYVSVSRGRQAVSIYTDDKEHLLQSVSQSAERTSASELMEKRAVQAQEMQRLHLHQRKQDKAVEADNYLHSQFKNDGLQTTARTEQNQATR